ncbi:branched-chain amino acid aminotransferase [Saccharibacillus sp. CPCC 101409]|uniref:branched-chain amino acid aminotransferase n=1 Tax=Saccharibacillus sp. CPCC 101409 TaxID=3058041 RepID=UPI002671E284|nr:branched-chain amino acid aminotransferase [Saccharibacillus sp. CPCC 101409]MDO3413101.1 branched-chain amino acid aminotransferase [Saccharibacillus sp. CPCC 101409]
MQGELNNQLKIEKTTSPRVKPDYDKLGFGIHLTDHMFTMDFESGKGWHDAKIVPYGPIPMDPAAKVFHYGQTIFEGMKAYTGPDGSIRLFRPEKNFERFNRSCRRMNIPEVDAAFVLEALKELVRIDREWVPAEPGMSLYIRPFVIATEPQLGATPSLSYKMMIILSPVGAYYEEGLNPVRIHVETRDVRAVVGGVGEAKTAGNYAASMQAQENAHAAGYSQVLWLDGVHRRYVEEVGSMNVFFRIGDKVVTPALSGSILQGITRDSVIHLLRDLDIEVEERPITIDELCGYAEDGTLLEAFGTGTAAVISPIGEIGWNGRSYSIGGGQTGEWTQRLYDELTSLQRGDSEDRFGWTQTIVGAEAARG